MNKFKYYFVLLLAGVAIVSCSKKDDDNVEVVPLRDYQEQFNTDNADLEEYLKSNYITVDEATMDVKMSPITDPATQPSIMSYLNSVTFPKLVLREIPYVHGITYKMYYLVLREGIGTAPMNTDGALVAYRGEYLKRVEKTATEPSHLTTTFFEEVIYPNKTMDLYGVILGWSEIFPLFKTGTTTVNNDGTATYKDFGAGVLFIPSGLAYYAGTGNGGIPAYSPLIFSFKMYDFERMDHENDGFDRNTGDLLLRPDGVLDYFEDLNKDGFVRDYRNATTYPNPPVNPDDTDGDGIPDFLDHDDDGDGFTTRFEITKPTGQVGMGTLNGQPFYFGVRLSYPWDAILEDNPNTPNVDEREPRGIPRRPTGALADPSKPESATNVKAYTEEDFNAPSRLRIHLDKTYPIKKN